MVGIVARTQERAKYIQRVLGIDPKDSVLISTVNQVRGCLLRAVVWADYDIAPEVLVAIQPALVERPIEFTAGVFQW